MEPKKALSSSSSRRRDCDSLSVMRPADRSASMAICLPGMASSVKRAPTSAMRVAPLVMTTKLMVSRMAKTMRPMTKSPLITSREKPPMMKPAALDPSEPLDRMSRVVAMLSDRRSSVATSSTVGKAENSSGRSIHSATIRISTESAIDSASPMSIMKEGIGRKKIDRIATMPMAKPTSRPLRRGARAVLPGGRGAPVAPRRTGVIAAMLIRPRRSRWPVRRAHGPILCPTRHGGTGSLRRGGPGRRASPGNQDHACRLSGFKAPVGPNVALQPPIAAEASGAAGVHASRAGRSFPADPTVRARCRSPRDARPRAAAGAVPDHKTEFTMGILDSIIGGLLGGNQQGGASSPLGNVLSSMLGGGQAGAGSMGGQMGGGPMAGGLGGLLSQFQQAGLGNIAQSWVGGGDNHPVSPEQLQNVFGQDRVQDMASQAGMDQGDFLSQLSQHLPRAVDGMTPDGQLPADDGSMSV